MSLVVFSMSEAQVSKKAGGGAKPTECRKHEKRPAQTRASYRADSRQQIVDEKVYLAIK